MCRRRPAAALGRERAVKPFKCASLTTRCGWFSANTAAVHRIKFQNSHPLLITLEAIAGSTPEASQKYEMQTHHRLKTWQEIIGYYYDGRLFTCIKVGQKLRDTLLIKLNFSHLE